MFTFFLPFNLARIFTAFRHRSLCSILNRLFLRRLIVSARVYYLQSASVLIAEIFNTLRLEERHIICLDINHFSLVRVKANKHVANTFLRSAG